ncbi:MAG: type I methionyl aminopeptidase [Bacteroidota bacterium]
MIHYKNLEEIELIRKSALMVSKTLGLMASEIREGISTLELDRIAEIFIRDHGGEPSFKGYNGFPNSLCMSVNDAVVHGIPNHHRLKVGDILSIDCGVKMNGFHGDHAYTFIIGDTDRKTKKLVQVTYESLYKGIEQAREGNRIGAISQAIQKYAELHGFGVVRELVGHGLGKDLHEDPQVPNFGRRRKGARIKEGMVLAIEPMINQGKKDVYSLNDGWTVVTSDGKPSAHFEHDVAIVNGQAEILSTFSYVEDAIENNPYLLSLNRVPQQVV